MDPNELKKLREILATERAVLEAELSKIASRNPSIKGDWRVNFHKNDPSDTSDEKAESVREFEEDRAVEQNLELRLKEIDETLNKIKEGSYGKCDKCGSTIDKKRVEIMPAVRFCIDCAKKAVLT
ncbi:MAG: TraR/DksA C4-type zinc finger protein [Candidatus Yanofskybacteria bacterium]|nr:TraR/DksA C4-type zinc finger protein [Candidatus Yanofskybacteria bacterium]